MFFSRKESSRRIFGRSHAGFLRGSRQPVAWRLEVREDANGRGMFLPDIFQQARRGSSARLASYISAGGMRDLQPRSHADLHARQRQFVIRLCLLLLAFWVVFFLVPCG